MSEPYVGEIRMFGGTFAPVGWLFCDGALLAISENDTLFTLIGTTYGGDGQETFGLPDLRGRVPLHMGRGKDGNNYTLGEGGGVENVTLTVQQIPSHTHPLLCNSGAATDPNPANDVMAEQLAVSAYQSQGPAPLMAAESIGFIGGSEPHTNIQPYLAINFIISLYGIFPSQN